MQRFLQQLAHDRLHDHVREARKGVVEALDALDTYRLLPSEDELDEIENQLQRVEAFLQKIDSLTFPTPSSPSQDDVAQRRRQADSFPSKSNPLRKDA